MQKEHLEDLLRAGRPRFTPFLGQEEQALAERFLQGRGCPFAFSGGWPGAERRVLGVHLPEGAPFPITAFQTEIPKGFTLTHRDFLGALLALGIKREVVGDILIEGEKAFFFTLQQAQPLILGELARVGRVGVRVAPALGEIAFEQRFEVFERSVASLRLDCVVAALADLSRGSAAELIAAGLVSLGGTPCQKPDRPVADGDRLSVRGKGKFMVALCPGRTTRKGRTVIRCKKYL